MPIGVAIIGSLEVITGILIILSGIPFLMIQFSLKFAHLLIGIGSTVVIILGIIQLLIGIGFLSGNNISRIITIIFSLFDLLLFPIGTIFGLIMLIYLFTPGVREYFGN